MRSDHDSSDLRKHYDTLFTEIVSQCESGQLLNARLCPGAGGGPERVHLGLLLAASESLRRLVQEAGLAEEEDVTFILADTSKQDLVCFWKCLYGREERTEAVSCIFTILGLGIENPPERKMTVAQNNIGASSVETLLTFNLPSNLSHPDAVVDLKDISIEDLNSSLINNTTTAALINTIDVNKLGDSKAVVQNHKHSKLDNQQKVSTKSDTVPKKFQCSICFKKLATEKKLQSHRARVHLSSAAKIAAFKCSECDLNLASANSLEIHLRSHTGHRQFSWSDCEK